MGEREPDHVCWSSDAERRLLGPLSAGTDDGPLSATALAENFPQIL